MTTSIPVNIEALLEIFRNLKPTWYDDDDDDEAALVSAPTETSIDTFRNLWQILLKAAPELILSSKEAHLCRLIDSSLSIEWGRPLDPHHVWCTISPEGHIIIRHVNMIHTPKTVFGPDQITECVNTISSLLRS